MPAGVPRPGRGAAGTEGPALLTGEETDLEDLDPAEAAAELARRLAEYRRIKEAAAWLVDRLDEESDRYFRLGPARLRRRSSAG